MLYLNYNNVMFYSQQKKDTSESFTIIVTDIFHKINL